jgi:hypothetical protein
VPDFDNSDYEDLDEVQLQKKKRAAPLIALHLTADKALEEGFTKDEEENMLEVLRAARKLQRVGLRASNIAAATDVRAVANRLQDEVRTS